MTKTLCVYVENSVYKYPELFNRYTFGVLSCGDLVVNMFSTIDGEEFQIARFKTWNYYLIDIDK